MNRSEIDGAARVVNPAPNVVERSARDGSRHGLVAAIALTVELSSTRLATAAARAARSATVDIRLIAVFYSIAARETHTSCL